MKILAAMAIVPLAIGPVPEEDPVLIATLCNGGTIAIPLGNKDETPKRDCHQKACHAGTCRQKAKTTKP